MYGATARTLAAIEEKTEGTRTTVNTLNERMIGAVMGKVLPEAAASPGMDAEELARRVSGLMQRQLENAQRLPGSEVAELGYRHSELRELPLPSENELAVAARLFAQLTDTELDDLYYLGHDYRRYPSRRASSISHGVGALSSPHTLQDKGLIRSVTVGWHPDPVYVLTDLGVAVAGLLLAAQLPYQVPADVVAARQRLRRRRSTEPPIRAGGEF